MLLGFYFVLVIALPLALGSLVVFHRMPRSRRCPGCAGETIRLRSPAMALLSLPLRSQEVHARWCPGCGWQGAARLAPAITLRADPGLRETSSAGSDREGVAIRKLDLNGAEWRVVLECWSVEQVWKGRFRFERGGHVWTDEDSPLEGYSVIEVITQAMALPDGTLAGRIRKATR